MKKKWISAILIGYLVCFGFACQTTKFVHLTPGVEKSKYSKKEIYAVVTLDNDWIEFQKDDPGHFKFGHISGLAKDEQGRRSNVKIPITQVKMLWYSSVSALDTGRRLITYFGLAVVGLLVLGNSSGR